RVASSPCSSPGCCSSGSRPFAIARPTRNEKENRMSSMSRIFTGWRIGQRPRVAFGVIVALMMVAVAVSIATALINQGVVDHILNVQARLADESSRAQVATLELRRFEKDMFLNLGDPAKMTEYEGKWKAQRTTLADGLTDLAALATDGADQAS